MNSTFTPIWHKYRPAIVKLMLNSLEEPQTYKLSAHEFKALNARPKGGHQFHLQVSKGKALNNIKDSLVAQDLLSILQQSRKAIELMDADPYEITLDKDFILHIQKIKNNTN